jgi:hypothetical protein
MQKLPPLENLAAVDIDPNQQQFNRKPSNNNHLFFETAPPENKSIGHFLLLGVTIPHRIDGLIL